MGTLIALTGFARSGKDTVGDRLVAEHGFVRFAFADVLRESLFELDCFLDGQTPLNLVPGSLTALGRNRLHGAEITRLVGSFVEDVVDLTLDRGPIDSDHALELMRVLNPRVDGTVTVRRVVGDLGWEGAKTHRVFGPEIRRLLQVLGTEVLRTTFGANVFPDELVRRIGESFATGGVHPVVVTDARFDDEAQVLIERGALVVRVERPGVGPVNAHDSDRGIDPALVARVLSNDGDVAALHERVDALVNDPGRRLRAVA